MEDERPLLRRYRIVVTARALVLEEGVDALSLRRLADRLDVSPAALYQHVEGKEDLLRAVAESVAEDVADVEAAAARGRTGADRLRAIAEARLAEAEARPALHRLVATLVPDDGDDPTELAVRRLVDALALGADPPARRRAALAAALERFGEGDRR